MINALELPSDVNLADFSRLLSRHGLDHRVTEEGENQVWWVADEQQAKLLQEAYQRFQAGERVIPGTQAAGVGVSMASKLYANGKRFPLTLSLILLNIVLFPVGMGIDQGEFGALFVHMIFAGIENHGGEWYFLSLKQSLLQGEFWRLFTPMFIHFGWMHLVFNLLWTWEIGRRIELINGAWLFVTVVMVSSLGANVTQYLMSGPSLFGGMSGVVFGLLGYSLVWSRLMPAQSTGLPKGIYVFMLIYLALGFTGALDLLGLGNIANGAHFGGLVAGLATGGLAGLLTRYSGATRQL